MDKLKIVYINLDRREDRNQHMIDEFKSLGITNYERFSAVEYKEKIDPKARGGIGCGLSHIKILNEFLLSDVSLETCIMIVEDDATFTIGKEMIDMMINTFIKSNGDILCLGYDSYQQENYNNLFNRTFHSLTTSCYIVKKHFVETLMNSFNVSINALMTNPDKYHLYAIDQIWTQLQKKYIFLIPKIHVVKQYASYSDIVHRFVDRKI